MLRRQFIALPAAAMAAFAQGRREGAGTDTAVASATQDSTPRVAIVLSSFKGSEDHDGTPLKGLRSPGAVDGPVTAAQLEEMVARALEFGNTRRGGLRSIVGDADWIVIKPHVAVRADASGKTLPGYVADPRITGALLNWLAPHAAGKRITIAEGPSVSTPGTDPWTSTWDGAFGGLSYRAQVDAVARKYPRVRFDVVDLNRDETMEMQTPARAGTSDAVSYKIASTLIRCPVMITVAPLAASAAAGVSLTLGSYLGALPAAEYGLAKEKASSLGPVAEVLVDVFSFRPPDYAIVGGEWALGSSGPEGAGPVPVRHNLIIAGANAVAVDSVGAAVLGLDPARVPHLKLAADRGFGITDLDSIWTRGNEIEEAKLRPHTGAGR